MTLPLRDCLRLIKDTYGFSYDSSLERLLKANKMRIKFKKGKQREFLKEVLEKVNCPSLRELRKRGFDVSYSALKNYFIERRNLSSELFEQLCEFSGLDKNKYNFKTLEENYGQRIGGKKSRK